ncbi:MAG: UDP-N-acetylmuramoyl-L-alanine--D-glutamate ligase [Rhizobiales bacterium]|nr:UDP-N-acetylmuramoyl-L-alanine--D-glutamate ligase [Hyphomicrobiales bacterium]
MTPVTVFSGRTVAVFGLGKSGRMTCQALIAGGARVVAADDNAASLAEAAAAGIPIGDLRTIDWSTVAVLVLAPGAPLTHPAPHWAVLLAQRANVPVIGDIDLFCRERAKSAPGAPFVAITGTNGKSTTTALVAHILRSAGRDVQMGGNIGVPILSLEPSSRARVHVIEMSSFQIDLAPALDPTVGVLLNVSEDHLDRHGTMENYAAIKERLVAGVQGGGIAIVGVDDDWCRAIADRLEKQCRRLVRISVHQALVQGVTVEGNRIVAATERGRETVAELAGISSLRGVHNAQNAACAAAAMLALGLSPHDIQQGLRSFPGLAHRMEEVGRRGAVLFVNDSKATNVDSAAVALVCFTDIFWILGGKAKTGGIASLTQFFPRVAKAYLIGEATEEFAATLEGRVPYVRCGTMDRAVVAAAFDAESSGLAAPVVLLSPACASFDQYRNFEVRGDAFRKLVQALPGKRP